MGKDLHAILFEEPAEGLVVGFGDFLGPGSEVGDELLLIGVLRGVVHPAFVTDVDGFQEARKMLELLMWCLQ